MISLNRGKYSLKDRLRGNCAYDIVTMLGYLKVRRKNE